MKVQVTVLFFASLREEFNTEQMTLSLPSGSTTACLPEALSDSLERPIGEVLDQEGVRLAVNFEILEDPIELRDGDEVAFFPPITGG